MVDDIAFRPYAYPRVEADAMDGKWGGMVGWVALSFVVLATLSCGTSGGGADRLTEADIVYTKKPALVGALWGGEWYGDALLPGVRKEAARIASEGGFRIDLAEASVDPYDAAALSARLDEWGAAGRDRFLALSWILQDALERAASRLPDSRFALVLGSSRLANTVGTDFRYEEAGFVAGWAAARAARSRGFAAVGYLGGSEDATEVALEAGFTAGARAAEPGIAVLVAYHPTGSGDETQNAMIAEYLFARGAGIIACVSWSMGGGALDAAAARAASGDMRSVIGLWTDLRESRPGGPAGRTALLSVVCDEGALARKALEALVTEAFEGGRTLAVGAADGAFRLSEGNPGEGEALVPELEAVLARIAAGEFEIPDFPEERYLGR